MPEQAQTQSNEDYLAMHPNAIVDPAKAEHIAYATKAGEEAIADLGQQAVAKILESGRPDGEITDPRGAGREADRIRMINTHVARGLIRQAQDHREASDYIADVAGRVYDDAQALKSGKNRVSGQG